MNQRGRCSISALSKSKIANVRISRVQIPLKKPYVLSFATLDHFVSVQAEVDLEDGQRRVAEVVPLYGYSEETEESILEFLHFNGPRLRGLSLAEARACASERLESQPFACSPLLTAIDLFDWKWKNQVDLKKIKFVQPSATENARELSALVAGAAPGTTIKIKLSGKNDIDIAALKDLPDAKGVILRLDANQGFSHSDASTFFEFIAEWRLHSRMEYVEQPLHAGDWEGASRLAANFPNVPLMLDESVVTLEHVERVKQLNIPYVKLKLFKQGGMTELLRCAQRAKELGLRTVLGNGVATWLSNEIELRTLADHETLFWGASEANGFLKIDKGVGTYGHHQTEL